MELKCRKVFGYSIEVDEVKAVMGLHRHDDRLDTNSHRLFHTLIQLLQLAYHDHTGTAKNGMYRIAK